MCIRDRGVGGQGLAVFGHLAHGQLELGEHGLAIHGALELVHEVVDEIGPVSYTHLDVYKRQPLGFGDWRCATSLISGFIAKESVVSTLEILLGGAALSTLFASRAAISFLVFTLLPWPGWPWAPWS